MAEYWLKKKNRFVCDNFPQIIISMLEIVSSQQGIVDESLDLIPVLCDAGESDDRWEWEFQATTNIITILNKCILFYLI